MLKYWKAILLVLVLLATGLAYYGYNIIYGPNISDTLIETSLNLPQGTDFDLLTKILVDKDIVIDESNFRMVSKLMKFDTRRNVSGRFEIVPGWSNRELISLLRVTK